MKIGDFIPDIVNRDSQLVKANNFLANGPYDGGFGNFYKSRNGPIGGSSGSSGHLSEAQPYGIKVSALQK